MKPKPGWQHGVRSSCRSPLSCRLHPAPGAAAARPPNQKDLYDILIRAAAQSRLTLAADPHDVGGLIGVLCVLHTWPRALAYHPHVHGLVPAGGVSADHRGGRLEDVPRPSGPSLRCSAVWVSALVHQERPDLNLPASVWTTDWVVY